MPAKRLRTTIFSLSSCLLFVAGALLTAPAANAVPGQDLHCERAGTAFFTPPLDLSLTPTVIEEQDSELVLCVDTSVGYSEDVVSGKYDARFTGILSCELGLFVEGTVRITWYLDDGSTDHSTVELNGLPGGAGLGVTTGTVTAGRFEGDRVESAIDFQPLLDGAECLENGLDLTSFLGTMTFNHL